MILTDDPSPRHLGAFLQDVPGPDLILVKKAPLDNRQQVTQPEIHSQAAIHDSQMTPLPTCSASWAPGEDFG